jgi:phage tail P2-like protein
MKTLSQLSADELGLLQQSMNGLHIMDIDRVDPTFLPWLAWQWRVDVWDDSWPVSQQREVVKNALLLARYRGTPWAVKRALELTGYDATLTEWWQQAPEGERGTFRVDVVTSNTRAIDDVFYNQVFALVERNKRGSQHWLLRPGIHMKAGMYLPIVVNVCMKVMVTGEGNA